MKKTFLLSTLLCSAVLGSTTLRASSTDSRIENSAESSYTFKTTLKADKISTSAKDGVVTLTGTVSESYHKQLAGDTVASLPGVVRVNNNLVISGTEPAEHSDTWINTKVKTSLLFHRNVSASGTSVYVNDGVVTLQGVADSQAQKELTTEYAKDIDNVKSVVNNMTVANEAPAPGTSLSDKIDDASITAQVKTALLTHKSTSAIKTSVSTVGGVVTISGVARNDAERSLVTKLTQDITGVVSINNEMTVTTETN